MIKGVAMSHRRRCLNLHAAFYAPGPVQIFALTTAIRPLKIIPCAEMGGPLGKPLVVSVVGDNQFTDAIELHKRHEKETNLRWLPGGYIWLYRVQCGGTIRINIFM